MVDLGKKTAKTSIFPFKKRTYCITNLCAFCMNFFQICFPFLISSKKSRIHFLLVFIIGHLTLEIQHLIQNGNRVPVNPLPLSLPDNPHAARPIHRHRVHVALGVVVPRRLVQRVRELACARRVFRWCFYACSSVTSE